MSYTKFITKIKISPDILMWALMRKKIFNQFNQIKPGLYSLQ